MSVLELPVETERETPPKMSHLIDNERPTHTYCGLRILPSATPSPENDCVVCEEMWENQVRGHLGG